jgi:hypothetical protein
MRWAMFFISRLFTISTSTTLRRSCAAFFCAFIDTHATPASAINATVGAKAIFTRSGISARRKPITANPFEFPRPGSARTTYYHLQMFTIGLTRSDTLSCRAVKPGNDGNRPLNIPDGLRSRVGPGDGFLISGTYRLSDPALRPVGFEITGGLKWAP